MKLFCVGSFFSSRSKSKARKNRRSEWPSFRSAVAAAASSCSTSPNTVLCSAVSWSPSTSSVADLFSLFDGGGGGAITKRELEIVLQRLGPDRPTEEELASMLAEIELDPDCFAGLEELADNLPAALGQPAAGCEIRDAFAVFDEDGDGKISAEELLGVFLALGDLGCTIDDCRRMIGGVDSDGDGFVCFQDFARMMGAGS